MHTQEPVGVGGFVDNVSSSTTSSGFGVVGVQFPFDQCRPCEAKDGRGRAVTSRSGSSQLCDRACGDLPHRGAQGPHQDHRQTRPQRVIGNPKRPPIIQVLAQTVRKTNFVIREHIFFRSLAKNLLTTLFHQNKSQMIFLCVSKMLF